MVEDFFSMYESNGFHFYSAFYSIEWRHMAATPKVKWPETMTRLLCFPKRKGKCFGEQLYRLASYTVQFYAHIDCPQPKSARSNISAYKHSKQYMLIICTYYLVKS